MIIFDWAARLLFPPKCTLCGKLLKEEETDFCKMCRTEASEFMGRKTQIEFLDSFTAVWYYEGNVRGSLLRYKFGRRRSYADAYGRMLAMKLLREYPDGFDILTWVPVSPLRKIKRGFDQGELLARAVGRELNFPPLALLKKIRNNTPQSGISDPSLRRANVLGVYRMRTDLDLKGKRILLLDDILTTGSTAGEAAKTLRCAGAKEVHCAAIAAARK